MYVRYHSGKPPCATYLPGADADRYKFWEVILRVSRSLYALCRFDQRHVVVRCAGLEFWQIDRYVTHEIARSRISQVDCRWPTMPFDLLCLFMYDCASCTIDHSVLG